MYGSARVSTAAGGAGGVGVGGNGSKQSSLNVGGSIGGGNYYTPGGINFSFLEDLMEGMKSMFRVVRGKHHQANGSSARPYPLYLSYLSPASIAAAPNDGMPFPKEALGKPLQRLTAMSRQSGGWCTFVRIRHEGERQQWQGA